MFHVALVEPEIPPNTGNIARLCAATFTALHIVGATGFRMDDRTLKRSGLDYWSEVDLHRHLDSRVFTRHCRDRYFFISRQRRSGHTRIGNTLTATVLFSAGKPAGSRRTFCRKTATAV